MSIADKHARANQTVVVRVEKTGEYLTVRYGPDGEVESVEPYTWPEEMRERILFEMRPWWRRWRSRITRKGLPLGA